MKTQFFQIVGFFAFVITVVPVQADEVRDETSRVLRINVPKLAGGEHDVQFVLFSREGSFHHGYALTPTRDNLPHRVDVTPAPPIQFVTKAGKPIDVKEGAIGYYSYKNKHFLKYREQFNKGEIRVAHPGAPNPLKYAGGKLSGAVDVLLLTPDESNTPGRNAHNLVYRVVLNGRGKGDQATGSFEAWTYEKADNDYGVENERVKGEFTAYWDGNYWKAEKGTEYARGKDWPQARGPYLSGAAIDTASHIVNNLHDARLLWVAEDAIGSGRSGAVQRGDFQMYPATWTTLNYGGFSGPAVADGRVYLSLLEADLKEIAKDNRYKEDIYVQVGADPRVRAEHYGMLRDATICFDAQTGKKLWHYRSDQTFGNVPSSKAGRAGTCCVFGGRVYSRGSGGLYAFDAKSGKLLWHKFGSDESVKFTTHGGSWSQDRSPVMIGGTLIIDSDESLVGIDPKTGNVKWRVPNAIGQNAVPAKVEISGKTCIVSASRLYEPSEKDRKRGAIPSPERLLVIEPGSGKIVWEGKTLGTMPGTLCVWDDIAIGNGVRNLGDKDKAADHYRAAGVSLAKSRAKKLWQNDSVHYQQSRCTAVAKDGFAYLDSRLTGLTALDMKNGKILGRHPHIYHMSQGSHNWTWHIATNDRVLTSGVLMFSDAESGFELLPGRLSLDLASGYTCPIKPAIADGRLFARLADRLVCYDLRRKKGFQASAIRIECEDAVAGQAAESDSDVTVRVRLVGGGVDEAGAKWPKVTGPQRDEAAGWVGSWTSASAWRATDGAGLNVSADALAGETTLRLGWHKERWALDLKRDGDKFEGTYTRSVPTLSKPIGVKGAIDGKYAAGDGGIRRFDIYLLQAGDNKGLTRGEAKQGVCIVLRCRGDDILNAWGYAGRINIVAHEVDPSGLKVEGNRVTGEATVLFHDDQYYSLNFEQGTAVAATYTIDCRAKGDKTTGSHAGTIGVAWSRSGPASGVLHPELTSGHKR